MSLCCSVRASSSLLSSQPASERALAAGGVPRPSLVCNVSLFSPSLLSLQTLCTLQGPEVRARQRPTGQPWLQELTPDPTLLLKRFWMLMAFCVLLGNGVGGGRWSEPAVRTPLFGGVVATPLSGETSLWDEPLPLCWGTEPAVPGVRGDCPKPVGALGPRCTVGTWRPSKAEAPPLSQVWCRSTCFLFELATLTLKGTALPSRISVLGMAGGTWTAKYKWGGPPWGRGCVGIGDALPLPRSLSQAGRQSLGEAR